MDQSTTENITTPQSQDWEKVIKELEKIDTLRRNVVSISFEVQQMKNDVEVIKKIQGLDQNSEQQLEKEQNVIDKDGVPGTLTSSEKKRYQNIGAQFVKGAGKEFDKIKKAIQFKQKMKTSNDKFVEEVKNKEKTKKKTKSGGFWKKLLAVLGILGLVAFLFRDKIAKLLPDLSGGMSDIGNKIGTVFGGLIKNLSVVVVKFLGQNFSNIIDNVCTEIIPNIIKGFFHDTLPMVMVTTTLSVLSLFSDSAGEQLNKLLSGAAESDAHETESAAEMQVVQLKNGYDILNKTAAQLAEQQGGLERARYLWGNALYSENKFGESNQFVHDVMRGLGSAVGIGSDEIDERIKSGNINLTSLFSQLDEDSRISKLSDRRDAYVETLSKYLLDVNAADYQSKRGELVSWVNNNISEQSDSLRTVGQALITNQGYRQVVAALNKNNSSRAAAINSPPTVDTVSQPMSFVTQINVQQAMLAGFADGVNGVLKSINGFLNGENTNKSFLDVVNGYFTQLRTDCQQFFISNYVALTDIISESKGFFQIIKNWNPEGGGGGGTQIDISQPNVNGEEGDYLGWTTNVLVMNVAINDHTATHVGSMLKGIKQHSASIKKNVEDSIQHLTNINAQLQKQIVIKGGQTVDLSKSLEPINDTIGKQNKRIDQLQKKAHTHADPAEGDEEQPNSVDT